MQFESLCICVFQLVAVYDEVQRGRTDSPRETMSNGFSSAAPSPEPLHYFAHLQYSEPIRGEIEVNEASLKASMSHLLCVFLCVCWNLFTFSDEDGSLHHSVRADFEWLQLVVHVQGAVLNVKEVLEKVSQNISAMLNQHFHNFFVHVKKCIVARQREVCLRVGVCVSARE